MGDWVGGGGLSHGGDFCSSPGVVGGGGQKT
jgi:hypothetical protein